MKKVFFHTFGCKVNQYDTQVLREYFRKNGAVETGEDMESADVIVINSCTVTGEADRQCRQLMRQALKKNTAARIVVTGCYAVRAAQELRQISPRIEVVAEKGELSGGGGYSPAISAFEGHSRAFVKIQDGCDAFCSYCIVPYVRPTMWSRPVKEVLSEIEALRNKGYSEMVLSGVHLGRYAFGLDSLLEGIVSLPGNFRVRLSSLEVNEVDERLIALMREHADRICPHLHLPLQSGSDTVLRRMNRPYTGDSFRKTAESLLHLLPDIGISTDIIVGFPGERDEDFEKSCELAACGIFSRLHVFKYSPRSGTAAADYKDVVSADVSARRSKFLRELDQKLQDGFWRRFSGRCRPVVVEGGKKTLLTDNYIRLLTDYDFKSDSKYAGIFIARIEGRSGRPWGSIPESREKGR